MELEKIDNGEEGVAYVIKDHKAGGYAGDSGLYEHQITFGDESTQGSLTEIYMEGARIFFSESELQKKVTIYDEVDTPSLEMHFNFEGKSRAKFEGSSEVHSIGDEQHNIFYTPQFKGSYHLESKKMKNFEVQLESNFFDRLIDESSRPLSNLAESIQKGESMRIAPENLVITAGMKAIIYDIMNCSRSGHMKQLFLEAKIIELFMKQVEQTESATHATRMKKRDIERVRAAKTVLEKNPFESFTLKSLAHKVELNDYKLKKGFRDLFGTTVFNYLNELRMTLARQMLLDENKAVYEVSEVLGYSEPHHFSAAFKRTFGYSPSELKGTK